MVVNPGGMPELDGHETDKDDLVLQLRRPLEGAGKGADYKLPTFASRLDANRALRDLEKEH